MLVRKNRSFDVEGDNGKSQLCLARLARLSLCFLRSPRAPEQAFVYLHTMLKLNGDLH
jgi:IS1 family transposase